MMQFWATIHAKSFSWWGLETSSWSSSWTDQLRNDTGSVPANLWRQATLRGHVGV